MLGYCMSARNPFEFFPSPTLPGVAPAFGSIQSLQISSISPSASPLFSDPCKAVCNSLIIGGFNSLSFQIHAYTFPGSPVLSSFYKLGTGGVHTHRTSGAALPTRSGQFCAATTARYNEVLIRLLRKQSRVCGTASVAYGRFSRGARIAPPRPAPSSGKR
jgi:hypothetical protein